MDLHLIYQWSERIAKHLDTLNKWQAQNLALFSLGVVRAESCIQRAVAKALYKVGKWQSMQRRFQRLLANQHVVLEACLVEWVGWVLGVLQTEDVILLVDETHLGDHLSMMMVGVAYEERCIPLAWRCYQKHPYPPEGQVQLIIELLKQVDAGLPADCVPLLQADRGIGTSPALLREVQQLGWRYLVRVQGGSKLTDADGTEHTLGQLVEPGGYWAGEGTVFKKRGQIPACARVIWAAGQEEPWVLVTNDPTLTGEEYAMRVWQEESFRDLKSGGWQWGRSHVWLPQHANRLMLVLALAYAWSLALGSAFIAAGRATALRREADGTLRRRFSVFQEGLNAFHDMLSRQQFTCPALMFLPDRRLT